ncbi:GDSL esterase/lipase At2g42990-like [Pistacia vera]|uniref:GDSL esterase/lipase At2g42990-like n=1 Tax=Pistacia vera TaxID=55513 RepID=UPI00126384DE|nr:GDSL esterase/lipase At2g42990-like [Pistacia vera]
MGNSSYRIPGPCLTILLTLVCTGTARAKVPALIIFGDSTVDTGNNNFRPTLLKSNFAPYGRDFEGGRATGRFCNGRLPPDFVSESFGLKPTVPAYLDPAYNITDFATGVTFASAGSGYDNATAMASNVIPLWKEVEMYKDYQGKLRAHFGEEKAKEIISNSLYMLSLGTNDFMLNFYVFPYRRTQFTVKQYEVFIIAAAEKFIRQLYSLGARKLSVSALPPMGCLPFERFLNINGRHDCVTLYNKVAMEFNVKMHNLMVKLNKKLTGIKILESSIYDVLYQMITKPSSFGFKEKVDKAKGKTFSWKMTSLVTKIEWVDKLCKI